VCGLVLLISQTKSCITEELCSQQWLELVLLLWLNQLHKVWFCRKVVDYALIISTVADNAAKTAASLNMTSK
jgi:hypothetical protein